MSSIVSTFLFLDLLHSCLLLAADWQWFIIEHGTQADRIPIAIPLSVLVTAISTFLAHSVYWWRIFRFSKHNYWISTPIIILAALRVVAATVSTSEMIRLKSFQDFRTKIGWVFSVGLALSSIVDVLITGVMVIILRHSREKSLSMDGVIDSLVVYTFESGSVTALATIASLITWLAMDNLVFLGLHFVLAKLYANSVVAMLNYRQSLTQSRIMPQTSSSRSGNPVDLDGRLDVIRLDANPSTRQGRRLIFLPNGARAPTSNIAPMEVSVTKTMQMHIDDNSMDVQHEEMDKSMSNTE